LHPTPSKPRKARRGARKIGHDQNLRFGTRGETPPLSWDFMLSKLNLGCKDLFYEWTGGKGGPRTYHFIKVLWSHICATFGRSWGAGTADFTFN
jgi:hypothetical protein